MSAAPFTPDRAGRRARLRDARLYVLATESVARGPWLDAVRRALAGGADVVQLREKALDDAAFAARAAALRDLCREHGALFVVNDRVEAARAVGADGVHLGQEDVSVAAARALLGPDVLVGVSTHDAGELDDALRDGADCVGVGSVFPTATKGRDVPVGSPAALAPLAARAEAAGVPAFAIGGIDVARAPAVAAAGFTRVATCAGVLAAEDPEAAARAIRAALRG